LIYIMNELVHMGIDVRLDMFGHVVDERYFAECRRLIGSLQLSNVIEFHGNIAPKDIVVQMDESDALLLVSKQEVAPMVVAEAHCRGLPVAVPRDFGLRSMVAEGSNGVFLDGATVAGDALKIFTLLECKMDKKHIQNNAFNEYSPDRVITKTIAVYNDMISFSKEHQLSTSTLYV
jgi:glycosyltransferase involved in cell wall biosynthesis